LFSQQYEVGTPGKHVPITTMLLLRFYLFMGRFFLALLCSLERFRVWSFVALSRLPAYTSSTS
jgi:hypothetical protein